MEDIIYLVRYYSPDMAASYELVDNKPITLPREGDYLTLETQLGFFSGVVGHMGHWIGYSEEYGGLTHFSSAQLAEIPNDEAPQKAPEKL